MNFVLALLAWIVMGFIIGVGMYFVVKGSFALFIISVLGFFGLMGWTCIRP
jgi:hypothetical protein